MTKIIIALISSTIIYGTTSASTYYYYQNNQISNIGNLKHSINFLIVGHDKISNSALLTTDTNYYLGDGKSNDVTISTNTLQTTDYSGYGQVTAKNSKMANSFRYNNAYQDPTTKLIYLKARDYNPSIQNFMTMDSYSVWNKYNFTDADPIGHVDPTGHLTMKWYEWLSIGLGTAAALSGFMNYRYASHFSSLNMKDPQALTEFAKQRGITDIHVDIDDTLIKVKPTSRIAETELEDWLDIEPGMSTKYDKKMDTEKRYAFKTNWDLYEQIRTAKENDLRVHILSTESWQPGAFDSIFDIQFDSFSNKQDVDDLLSFKPSRFGSIAKGFTKWRAINTNNSLLIDDQTHQRLGFWLFNTSSYAMNPGSWQNQDFNYYVDDNAYEI